MGGLFADRSLGRQHAGQGGQWDLRQFGDQCGPSLGPEKAIVFCARDEHGHVGESVDLSALENTEGIAPFQG